MGSGHLSCRWSLGSQGQPQPHRQWRVNSTFVPPGPRAGGCEFERHDSAGSARTSSTAATASLHTVCSTAGLETAFQTL